MVAANSRRSPAPYKFGFILSTALGNRTRYLNFRKFAERDPEVECVWAPVQHYIEAGEENPFRNWPSPLRKRAIVLRQAAPVLRQFGTFDAVMIHLYEVDILTALRSYWAPSPLRVVSADDAPVLDERYPLHPVDARKPAWRRRLRLGIDLWRARRADLLIPFSEWAGEILVGGAGIEPTRVLPIHVGVDLDTWTCPPREPRRDEARVRLLFVGGEFERKGGDRLLEAFRRRLSGIAELHLVTRADLHDLPPGVVLHRDLSANDPHLMQLYRDADIFVLPTTSDLSSWVVLEAMASGCPVITTRVGGIPDLVEDGASALFVEVGEVEGIADAVEALAADPARRLAMGARGRRIVESRFDASVNVPAILEAMKALTHSRQNGARGRRDPPPQGGRPSDGSRHIHGFRGIAHAL